MTQVTLTSVTRTPRLSKKTGKPFTSLTLRCKEYGERFLSGFGNDRNASWEPGHSVDIIVEQKGEYLNFSMPKEAPVAPVATPTEPRDLSNVFAGIQNLERLLKEVKAAIQANTDRIDRVLTGNE